MKSRSSTWIWRSTISICGQLAGRAGEKSIATGILDGKLAAFGSLRALQVTTTFRLEGSWAGADEKFNRFSWSTGRQPDRGGCHRVFRDFQSGLPCARRCPCDWKKAIGGGNGARPTKPFSLALDCPALFLETLPNEWRAGRRTWTGDGDDRVGRDVAGSHDQRRSKPSGCALSPPPPWPDVNKLRGTSPLP